MSEFSPCKAVLKANAPVRIEANLIRPKGLAQQKFLTEKIQRSLKAGLIKECKFPKYSSAAFSVLKPHQMSGTKSTFRIVFDMR